MEKMEKKTDILLCVTTIPVSTKHIAWFTTRSINGLGPATISLCEVVEETHPHPSAPEFANITILQTRCVRSVSVTDPEAAAYLLVEAAGENANNFSRRLNPR